MRVSHQSKQNSMTVQTGNLRIVTPTTVKKLLESGYNVNIEKSPVRIFEDHEFSEVGATLVETGSWPNAPARHIVVGLKECKMHSVLLDRAV